MNLLLPCVLLLLSVPCYLVKNYKLSKSTCLCNTDKCAEKFQCKNTRVKIIEVIWKENNYCGPRNMTKFPGYQVCSSSLNQWDGTEYYRRFDGSYNPSRTTAITTGPTDVDFTYNLTDFLLSTNQTCFKAKGYLHFYMRYWCYEGCYPIEYNGYSIPASFSGEKISNNSINCHGKAGSQIPDFDITALCVKITDEPKLIIRGDSVCLDEATTTDLELKLTTTDTLTTTATDSDSITTAEVIKNIQDDINKFHNQYSNESDREVLQDLNEIEHNIYNSAKLSPPVDVSKSSNAVQVVEIDSYKYGYVNLKASSKPNAQHSTVSIPSEDDSHASFDSQMLNNLVNDLTRDKQFIPVVVVVVKDKVFNNIKYDSNKFDVMSHTSVVSVTVGESNENIKLPGNISVVFNHDNQTENTTKEAMCVYLNEETLQWSGDGCTILIASSHRTTCTCNHITKFTLLFATRHVEDDDFWRMAFFEYTFPILLLFNAVCCAIVLYWRIVCRRALHSHAASSRMSDSRCPPLYNTIAQLALCLLMTDILIIIFNYKHILVISKEYLFILCALIHFWASSSFLWMLAIALKSTIAVMALSSVAEKLNKKDLVWTTFCYGIPCVIVGICIFLNCVSIQIYSVDGSFLLPHVRAVIFTYPICIIIIVNVLITLRNCYELYKSPQMFSKFKVIMMFLIVFSVSSGLFWLVIPLVLVSNSALLDFVFAFTICFQGVFLVISFYRVHRKQISKSSEYTKSKSTSNNQRSKSTSSSKISYSTKSKDQNNLSYEHCSDGSDECVNEPKYINKESKNAVVFQTKDFSVPGGASEV